MPFVSNIIITQIARSRTPVISCSSSLLPKTQSHPTAEIETTETFKEQKASKTKRAIGQYPCFKSQSFQTLCTPRVPDSESKGNIKSITVSPSFQILCTPRVPDSESKATLNTSKSCVLLESLTQSPGKEYHD